MYIKLLRHEKYNTSDFFDINDVYLKKIKFIIFKSRHCEKKIPIIKNEFEINDLYVDCYDILFIDSRNTIYDSKYMYAFVIFNPYSNKDAIKYYDKINNYLLSTHKIIHGNPEAPELWTFDVNNLLCKRVIYDLLKKASYASNIVEYVREIGKLINYNGNYGLICANWKKGAKIIKDKSLSNILYNYINRKIINEYGQCFIFSAVLCGIFRHLNIPSRTVTCLNALHDGDQDGNITNKFGSFKNFVEQPQTCKEDFVWNYHIWTECFIEEEWYCIDSSPIYKNENGDCVIGPAKVNSIKFGTNLNDNNNNFDVKLFSNTVGNGTNNVNLNKKIKILTYNNDVIIDLTNNYKIDKSYHKKKTFDTIIKSIKDKIN